MSQMDAGAARGDAAEGADGELTDESLDAVSGGWFADVLRATAPGFSPAADEPVTPRIVEP